MPTSLSQAFGLSGSRVSILTVTTSKLGPPNFFSSASSDGISLRQGTHQVAHRLSSTVRPRQLSSASGRPSASWKARLGTLSWLLATMTAATSPVASGAIFAARATAGRQITSFAMSLGGPPNRLPVRAAIPYTPARPTATPASPPMRTRTSRLMAGFLDGRSVMRGETLRSRSAIRAGR